ncbi:olfactory receptor 1509-like [Esox lucius]|uniref:Olfactory receptor n=1 Tax=Esox lucius TaxID=8010 RepID=A0A3P8ZA25_ESOLU|nr:olfactory receptor 1509-like [Esox lucius]
MNSTQFTSFILAGYSDIGQLKYLYVLIMTVLCISIWFSNILLIVVICIERNLHKPMYLILCSLFVNDLYGSTALYPAIMIHLVSDVHSISTGHCYLQIFCIYTYGCIEVGNLAVMSYDRYLAICHPLQYTVIMTPKKVCVLICVIWFCMSVHMILNVSLTARLEFCGNVIDKLFCDNYLIVKLACSASDAAVNNIFGLLSYNLIFMVCLFTIFFSYTAILTICLKSSIATRKKALSTCTPHLASLINFFFGCFFTVLQSRFDSPMKHFPSEVKAILSVYFAMIQPLFNPILYGMRMSKLRKACKNVLVLGQYPDK